jgi:hypothetical protein
MPKDGTARAADRSHPSWCDPGECTAVRDHPYGAHQSASQVIAPEAPSGTAIELHLTSLFRGVEPSPLLLVEFADRADEPVPYLLTLPQARRLRDTLADLLTAAGQGQADAVPAAATYAPAI